MFGEDHLDDLTDRLPHADVHRFEGAGHLIAEERPYADVVLDWLDENVVDAVTPPTRSRRSAPRSALPPPPQPRRSTAPAGHLWDALDARRDDDDTAVIDMTTVREGAPLRVSWRQLSARVDELAAGSTPSACARATACRCSCSRDPPSPPPCTRVCASGPWSSWDRGLGIRGLSRAVRGPFPTS